MSGKEKAHHYTERIAGGTGWDRGGRGKDRECAVASTNV